MTDLREQAALRDQCTVFLTGHGPVRPAELREWRKRMGGRLHRLWPGAASALSCLRRRLPLMPHYLGHAREIASVLRGTPGVRVVPDPPQVSMMHLLLAATQEGFAAAA